MSKSLHLRVDHSTAATAFLGVLAAVLTGCAASTGPRADLILYNGSIWTVNDGQPTAQAIAITGDTITAVGTDDEVLPYRGPRTDLIDLHGNFALPGFNDSHVHFASAARFIEFNIMTTAAQEEFIARVQEVVASLPEGEWILGGYWGAYDQWAPGSAGGARRAPFTPEMRRVESITRDYPMFIQKFDGSEYAVNRAAMRAAGLDPDDPQADGVEFARDADGTPTGILRGPLAKDLFAPLIPDDFSRKRRLAQTRRALAEAVAHGVTSLSDMSDDVQLDLYRELHAASELPLRVHFRYPLDRWGELAARGIRVGSGDKWIRLGALKGHIDGIMGNSTARFFEPYSHDPDNRGRWRRLMVDEHGNFVPGKFLQYMLDADRAGLQLTVHAIGDEANHLLLNYLEELERRNGPKDRRFRLVHAQVVALPDMPRLGALGVIAEVQPYHLSDDMRWMEERIGRKRCEGAYAFRDIADSGAVLSFGTDWPGTSASSYPINPMLVLYAAVTRQTLSGHPPEGWFPQQRITIEEAIRAYTLDNAYASFEENIKGSLEPGKLADVVVLSRNLLTIEPEGILDTRVLMTITGGRIVYERKP